MLLSLLVPEHFALEQLALCFIPAGNVTQATNLTGCPEIFKFATPFDLSFGGDWVIKIPAQ
jgi:hypothetical protein